MEKKEIQETLIPFSTRLQTIGYALILLGILFFVMYPRFQPSIIKHAEHKIQQHLNVKNEKIAEIITHHTKKAESYARNKEVIDLLVSEEKIDTRNVLKKTIITKEYYDVLIVDATGAVVFVADKTQFVGQNFLTGDYKNSPLGNCLQLTNSTLDTQFSRFDNAFSKDTISFFVATPIITDEKLMGFLIFEINPKKIFLQLEDHTQLGRTGEIILVQAHDDHTRFINKPRLNPTLQFQITPPFDAQLYGATKGKQDAGTTTDYRKQQIVAAWDYVPTLDAGLIVKQDLKEVLLSFNIITLLIFLFMIVAIFLFFSMTYAQHVTRAWFTSTIKNSTKKLKKSLALIWLYAAIGLTGFMLLFCIHRYKTIIIISNNDAQSINTSNLRYVAQMINREFHNLQNSAHTLATNLSTKELSQEVLSNEVLYQLENNDAIHSITIAYQRYAHDPETELHAPSWIRAKRGILFNPLEKTYNYTLPESAGKMQTDWFLNASHGEKGWHGPLDKKTNSKKVLIYSIPFFEPDNQKNVRGVVAIAFRLKTLNFLLDYLGLRPGEKSIVVDHHGRFIAHPNKDFVIHKRTLHESVKGESKKSALSDLLQKHVMSLSPNPTWTYVEKIPLTQWLIASTFLQEHVPNNQQQLLNVKIEALVSLILFLFFLCLLFLPYYIKDKNLLYKVSSFSYSLILLSVCLTCWWFIHDKKWEPSPHDFIVNNKVRLQKYLDNARQDALSKNLPPPLSLKTGIRIKEIEFPNPTNITFNADMWQKYHDKDHASLDIPYVTYPEIDPKINELAKLYRDYQPRLSISKKIKLSMSESFRKKEKETTIIGWKAFCQIKLDDHNHHYPFNKTDLVINLRHKDITKSVIPIPDFSEYHNTLDNPYPWISKNVNFPGYTVEETFFSYRNNKSQTESALPEPSKLNLHIILKRNIINPFYLYFMPFLVILFTIFSVLNADALSRVTAYTGLLFATILLNQSLRSALQINDIIYVEYLFFFTYITLLLLISQGIWARLSTSETLQKIIEKALMLLFWPFQLTLWFVTTLLVFYT